MSAPRKRWLGVALLTSVIATIFGIAILLWCSFVLVLIARLQPSKISNGLGTITRTWQGPSDSIRLLSPWPYDFSRDIVPKACHSHNDYWRRVPLFDALAAGCIGVEADIWLPDQQNTSIELRVGHTSSSLRDDRTLSSLYIQPLVTILSNLASTKAPGAGVFETNPHQTLVLLLDFKDNGTKLWPIVDAQLEPLRKNRWLRHWDGLTETIVPGPVTVVASGNAPFNLVVANHTCRDIFFDAPLNDLDSNRYNISNSFFASAALGKAVGKTFLGSFNARNRAALDSQIANARKRGLLSRYWDTPAWPISVRDRVWNTLVSHDVGMLNVDDLDSASRWNWEWCVVAGLTLCGW